LFDLTLHLIDLRVFDFDLFPMRFLLSLDLLEVVSFYLV
jgi:hypothetical protein